MVKIYKDRWIIVNNRKYFPLKDVLIFDIETSTIDKTKAISAENSNLKIWGAYSFNTGKLSYGRGGAAFQKLIDTHKIIVGHNIKGFDIPVMEKDCGTNFKYKILVDTLEVLRKPASKSEKEAMKKKGKRPIYGKGRSLIIGEARQIGMNDNRFPDFKLSTIAKHGHKLFGEHKVYGEYFKEYKDEEFDYDILNIKEPSDQQWAVIKEYLRQDIIVTKNLFEFLEKYFESFADGLNHKDIGNLEYMHAPMGKYVYKCICNALGLEEKYADVIPGKFPGAFVFLPTQERYGPEDGDGYCIDFASQHPSHQRMMNLCSPAKDCHQKVNGVCPTAHSGDGEIFTLKGTYCGCKRGTIEDLITKWYLNRVDFKKVKDPREYSVKIKINGTYGVLSSSMFESTYYEFTGEDTTRMSAQSTKFMDVWMREGGYITTYGDTDSLYIMDPFKDVERMKAWMAKGIIKIKAAMPFADKYYDMDIDAEFSHIFFFQDKESKDKHFKKKNYIYIMKNGKVKINGLPLLKSNSPLLAKRIYINYLEPEIKRTKKIKFDKPYIKQLIQFEIEKGLDVLATQVKVNPANGYATLNQMQAQISNHYFGGLSGIFKGIKHKRKGLGVGKGKHYCSLEEASDLSFRELDLDTVWKTLDPFVKEDKQLGIFDF